MAITPKKLYHGQPLDSIETLYTAVGNKTIIKNILISKAAEDDGMIDIHFVKNGDTPISQNKIISDYEVASPVISLDTSLVMENGDSIQALNKGTGKINLYISGVEVV